MKMTDSEFVVMWQAARSVQDAADQAGISYTNASMRASILRKMGVPLKRFNVKRARTPADVAALTALIK